MSADESSDVIGEERETSPKVEETARLGRRRGALVVLVVLAGTAVVSSLGDWYLRNRELDCLVTAVEQSEAAMVDAKNSFTMALKPYRFQTQLSAEKHVKLRDEIGLGCATLVGPVANPQCCA
jgi:hypothetical protein